jgi:LacI family transcriptional regulator
MLGAVFPSLDSALFGGALEAFQSEVAESGYTVVVASSGYDPQREHVHIRNLIESGIDGLMLIGSHRPPEVYRLIENTHIPYVLTWISSAPGNRPCIGFDNEAAAAHLAGYLVDLGHRQFAMLSGQTAHNDRASARLQGVQRLLGGKGLQLDPHNVFERPFRVDDGREAFQILMRREQPPTAIICGSEPLAYGAILEAQDMGISVPGDVSVAGFDDMWLAAQLRPSLTTVQTPRTEMGRDAARYLLAKLAGAEVAEPRPLETRLIVRKSTGPPPT